MKTKRIISLLLALIMILTMLPVQAFAVDTANSFRDVSEGDWYYDAVQYVHANGIFIGTPDGTFAPDDGMTRGMFVVVLGRMAGVDTENYQGKSFFSDVPENAYFAPYVAWASRYGITYGSGDGKFSPDALIDRQQLATFFVRYFDAFGVDYETGANITTTPADIDSVPSYARDAVLKLWRQGLLTGDGVNFVPGSNATRAQTATLCYRMDQVIETWYKEPGVPSDRVKIDPATGRPYGEQDKQPDEPAETPSSSGSNSGGSDGSGGGSGFDSCTVSFYEGERLIETFSVKKGEALGKLPSVSKSSKEGYILAGYYTDQDCTSPFYADEPVTGNMNVYAKYESMASQELLTIDSFARMDQDPDVSFRFKSLNGITGNAAAAKAAVTLVVKDGSDPVEIEVKDIGDGIYEVYAPDYFNKGCSYELNLAEGWTFLPEDSGAVPNSSVRTAAFSIKMAEVENLRMNKGITYIQDTSEINYTIDGDTMDVLDNRTDLSNGGSFDYGNADTLSEDDILCIYVGEMPDTEGRSATDPAVYVKVARVEGNTVYFTPLDENDQSRLYDIPDNFPIKVAALPTGENGTVDINNLDEALYAQMVGADKGTLDNAKAALGVNDFVTLYVNSADINSESDVYFGRITGVEGDTITFVESSAKEIEESGDLYKQVALAGTDLITPEEQKQLEQTMQTQVDNSGFGEEAAYMLLSMVSQTNSFQDTVGLRNVSIQDGDGNPLSADSIQYLAGIGDVGLNSVTTDVRLITSGDELHYNNGVQLMVDVLGEFEIITHEQGKIIINLSATFVQEVAFTPTVKGSLVTKKVLRVIPVPTGVQVTANVDVLSFTDMDISASIATTDDPLGDLVIDVKDELEKMMELASGGGAGKDDDSEGVVSQAYVDSLSALMDRYSELLEAETEWAQLVEADIFDAHTPAYFGVVLGIQGKYVLQADINLAIGSKLTYEMGKRYSFWFRVGLFKPTSGYSSMDLIDESLAFQFYVLGRMGLKTGVQAKIYAAIGSADIASVGITTEVGPYLKLYGFFIYDYSISRDNSTPPGRKAGAMYLDFGLYLAVGAEVTIWEWTAAEADLVDEEFPLLSAGGQRYYYDTAYEPLDETDEIVVYNDGSASVDGCTVSMVLPEDFRALRYIDLTTGAQGIETFSPDNYVYTLSNSNFRWTIEGGKLIVSVVSIPQNVRVMQCDLTITYKHGKLAFSSYDMSTTVHLVWTNMTAEEYQLVYTASVVVPDGNGGMETIWTKRVRKGEPFDLPTDAEIRSLLNWTDARYIATTGYGDQQTVGLTIIDNKQYTYNLGYQRYALTVSGIQGGSESSQTFTARYGESFDFSALLDTGLNGPTEYTRFAGLTLNGENLDLSRTVTSSFAEAVRVGNNATATARYVDDSVTVIFTFTGIDHVDITVTLRRGGTPDTSAVQAAVQEAQATDPNLAITGFYPAIGPTDGDMVYQVVCEMREGEKFTVTFDSNGGSECQSITRVDGVVLGTLPTPTRAGYDFDGWYTEDGTQVDANTVVNGNMTLHARWTKLPITVTFNTNGGVNLAENTMTVVYGQPYGKLPVPERSGYAFLGWFTQQEGGTQVTADTEVSTAENHTLYAHWRQRTSIPATVFDFGARESFTYEKGTVHLADYSFDPGELTDLDPDSFTVEYKRQDDEFMTGSDYTKEPVTAGTYIVRIQRPADEFYDAFEAVYGQDGGAQGVLEIQRATRDLSGITDANIKIVETGLTYVKAELVNVDDLDENAYIAYQVYGEVTNNGDVWNYATLVYDNQDVTSGQLYDLSSVSGKDPDKYKHSPYKITAVRVLGDINYEDTGWKTGLSFTFETKTNENVSTARPYERDTMSISWITWYDPNKTEYHIKSAEDLAGLALLVNYTNGSQGAHQDSFAGKTIYLDNDIDLSEYGWIPIGAYRLKAFSGTFDGQHHTISGLYRPFVSSDMVSGLFGYVKGATIKDVNLTDSLIYRPGGTSGDPFAGGLVAYILKGDKPTTITGCYSSALMRYSRHIKYTNTNEHVYDMGVGYSGFTATDRVRIYGALDPSVTATDYETTGCTYLPLVKMENEWLKTS